MVLAPPTDPSHPNDHSLIEHNNDPLHPAYLIPELCRGFYKLGWVTGTGGGISLRDGEKIYLAPSGVQKERIEPEDIFVLKMLMIQIEEQERDFLRWPVHKPLKQSACTPLFYNAYDLRNAGACIHTHSQHAVMATLLWRGSEFRISHQEMIKGMRIGGTGAALSYLDTLVIPIIENTPDEEDLREGMVEAMRKYPDAGQAECLDYLLEVAVRMKLAGMDTVGMDQWKK
ncbi:methylthioribulose-1-phosphate dehydratase [Rhodotorula toruloides]|uniref:Methylthioribulose-1-phosphate dehydratase n=1 Tax=Rhodotorula toruloides TaxID=5286 RepID=A0A511K8M5_RHOTO|nr:methylthioribulose-1-phosphate dehydratase [Rhodotorula toruloides]